MTGMFEILSKEALNPTVVRIAVSAPRIARKAEPGQFVILRAKEQSERIPLTVADYDREAGTVTVIYQIVGAGTMELNTLNAGDCLHDLTAGHLHAHGGAQKGLHRGRRRGVRHRLSRG